MATFPVREADIMALAQSIIAGMTENPDYPSPPLSPTELRARLDAFSGSSDAQASAQSAAQQATETKHTDLEELIAGMKAMLHYAEDAVRGNDAKLAALGWSGRAPRTPHVPQLPGQPRNVRAQQQGEGSMTLAWDEAEDGDPAACYKAERRSLNNGVWSAWQIVGTAVSTSIALSGQPRGNTLEYRIIAINNAGESLPSNTVTVVL